MTSNKVNKFKLFGGLALLVLSMESYAFGILFTTPQQRDALDQRRASGEEFSEMRQELSPTVTPPAKQMFFNGYVIRKSGPGTAWANHQVVTDNKDKNTPHNGITAKLNNIKGTSVPVKPSAISRSVRLQPGQLLNQVTGEITESYYQKHSTTQNSHSVKPEQEAEEPENDSPEHE